MSNRNDPNPIRLDDVQKTVWETPEELVSDFVADDLECLGIAQHLFNRLFDRGQKQQAKAWGPCFVVPRCLVDLDSASS